MIIMW